MNKEVTVLLDEINHPLRAQIEELRAIILSAAPSMEENIKWNGPNYQHLDRDRVTLKVQPAKDFHLILHAGTRIRSEPIDHQTVDPGRLFTWKSNDRGILQIKNAAGFDECKAQLGGIIGRWIKATEVF
ncbi:DUF1801 domain-containing protein [Pedobacter deserti]|uniref:DUF1801 domain-containing protein n=1 Tax=Pedobacter deserti TaxID=2817382 RepID=UPI002109A9F8|nr:DUF1801 domain-containing protein [Pedobacter sp. SYSU D00382]